MLIALNSCKNEIDINAPWRETPVVYALIDPNPASTIQYFRIQKSYQNSVNLTTQEGAQIGDSLYFDTLVVTLKTAGSPDIIFTQTGNKPKDKGFFDSNTHFLYEGNITPAIVAGKVYTLQIYSPASGITYTSSSASIGTSTFTNGRFNFNFAITNPVSIFTLSHSSGSALNSGTLLFNYTEFLAGNPQNADTFTVKYEIEETFSGTNYTVPSKKLVNHIKGLIPVKAGYERQIIGFDFITTGGGKEIKDLITVTSPNSSLIQNPVNYSNISNGGLGIFSSRNIMLTKEIQNTTSTWPTQKANLITELNRDPRNLKFIP